MEERRTGGRMEVDRGGQRRGVCVLLLQPVQTSLHLGALKQGEEAAKVTGVRAVGLDVLQLGGHNVLKSRAHGHLGFSTL